MFNFVKSLLGFDKDIGGSFDDIDSPVTPLLQAKKIPKPRYSYHNGDTAKAGELGIKFVGILFQDHEACPVPLRMSNAPNSEKTTKAKHYMHLSAKNSLIVLLEQQLEMVTRGELISPDLQKRKYLVNEFCGYFQCSLRQFWKVIMDRDKGLIENNKIGKVGPKSHITDPIVRFESCSQTATDKSQTAPNCIRCGKRVQQLLFPNSPSRVPSPWVGRVEC